MQVASINFPERDNNGKCVMAAVQLAVNDITEAFGGVTMTEGLGLWVHDGRVYRDNLIICQIAADWTDKARAKLREIAERYALEAGQMSVYVSFPDGVEFVEPETIAA